jgi:tetratricopeptide (TPR) repeat protein
LPAPRGSLERGPPPTSGAYIGGGGFGIVPTLLLACSKNESRGILRRPRRLHTVMSEHPIYQTPEQPDFLAPQLDPSPVQAYRQAWQLLQDRQPRRAIMLLEPAVEAEPASASLRTLRAWAYFQSAQLQRAQRDLETLVEDCPTDVWARFALGRVLERQSRYAEALPHLRLAAVMSGDAEHEAGVLRVERLLAEAAGSYDDLT